MLERLRRSVVESFIGAIGLGWLLAEIVLNFVGIFASPVASWITRREIPRMTDQMMRVPTDFFLRDALPGVIRTVLLAVIWYILLYWLYIRPAKERSLQPTATPKIPESA